jgi:hypothetical protein
MQRTRYPERRRTTRLSLQVPLTVRCRLPEGETIDLKASTYIVSAHGALVLMDTPLIPGQTVKVFNEHTAKSVDCVVTSLREKRERRFVGMAFVNPNIDFWHIVFRHPSGNPIFADRSAGASGVPAGKFPAILKGFCAADIARPQLLFPT